MSDNNSNLEDLLLPAGSDTMSKAKESICRIEESATRIHSIVNGAIKPNIVRTNTRRRDDYQIDYIKHWLIVAVVALMASMGCMTTYMWYEIHTSEAIVSMANKISNLETQVRQLTDTVSQLTSQSLNSKQ